MADKDFQNRLAGLFIVIMAIGFLWMIFLFGMQFCNSPGEKTYTPSDWKGR